MSKLLWNGLKLSPVLLGTTLILANRTMADSVVPAKKLATPNQTDTLLGQIEQYSLSPTTPITQETSVSNLSDVQPTDWELLAFQILVERYGCIASEPDSTDRGNRALTRYEFAAGLKACLDLVNKLIATGKSDLVRKEDLTTLLRLQAEFSVELATLNSRVNALSARTTEIEAHQFSPTVKLSGEAIFNLEGFTGGSTTLRNGRGGIITTNAESASNIALSDRLRINFNASFTGKDLLNIRFQPNNTISFAGNTLTGTNLTRLSFDGDNSNTAVINRLYYNFPFGKQARIFIGAVNTPDDFLKTITPYDIGGKGAISRFGIRSPIYRIGDTTTSFGFNYNIDYNTTSKIEISGLYAVPQAANSSPKNGLFNGTFAATGQISLKLTHLDLALTVVHAYLRNGNLGTATGSRLADNIGNSQPTNADSYGVEANWRISPKLIFTGWVNYTAANQTSGRGAAESFNYMAFLGFWDAFSKGDMLVFGFGQPPKLTGVQGAGIGGSERDTTHQIEAFYSIHTSDHLLITPGVVYIINPENNSSNKNTFVGVFRSTFTF